jgi:hypothetical protein
MRTMGDGHPRPVTNGGQARRALESSAQGGTQPTPLLARKLGVGGEHLNADMIGPCGEMLVHPTQDRVLATPRDDRIEKPVADRCQILLR